MTFLPPAHTGAHVGRQGWAENQQYRNRHAGPPETGQASGLQSHRTRQGSKDCPTLCGCPPRFRSTLSSHSETKLETPNTERMSVPQAYPAGCCGPATAMVRCRSSQTHTGTQTLILRAPIRAAWWSSRQQGRSPSNAADRAPRRTSPGLCTLCPACWSGAWWRTWDTAESVNAS